MQKGSGGCGSVADLPPTGAGAGPAGRPMVGDDLVPAILHVDMDAFFAAV